MIYAHDSAGGWTTRSILVPEVSNSLDAADPGNAVRWLVPALALVLVLIANAATARPLQLAAAPGLADHDVESVFRLEDRWLAGTARGVFSYDGTEWTSHAFSDTVRWLALQGGRILAGGSRGVWAADLSTLVFERIADSPPRNRCQLETDSGRFLIGTDLGLYELVEDRWEMRLPDHRVQSLAVHPSRGWLVGTWGDGLLVRAKDGRQTWVRCPAAGVTDTLSGNYIHDIEVDPDGTIRLACSYGQLAPRHRSFRFLQDRGLISERDPHTFLRASLARWTDEGWQVEYLLQDFSEKGVNRTLWQTLYTGKLRGSDRDQWVLALGAGRNFFPAGVVSFDQRTHEMLWHVEIAGAVTSAVPLLGPGGIDLICVSANSDHGACWGTHEDDVSRLVHIDGLGRMDILAESTGIYRFLPSPSEGRVLPPASFFEFVERPPMGGVETPGMLWSVEAGATPSDPPILRGGTPLCADMGRWTRRDRTGRLISGWDFDSAALKQCSVRDLVDCEVLSAFPDSLDRALKDEPTTKGRAVEMASTGRLAWLCLTPSHLYLSTNDTILSWPNPIPSTRRTYWGWDNILELSAPQVLVERGDRGPREIWGFADARHLRGSQSVYPNVLDRPGLAGMRLLSVFRPPWSSSQNPWAQLRALRDPAGQHVGWAAIDDDLHAVRLYSPEGAAIGSVEVPPELRGQSRLTWTPEVTDRRQASAPVIYSQNATSWSLYRLVDQGKRWDGPYEFRAPYLAHECNGITALSARVDVFGSEAGVRGIAPDPAHGQRVRGFADQSLVFGSFGVATTEFTPDELDGRRVSDAEICRGILYASTPGGVLEWKEGWRPVLQSPAGTARSFHLVASDRYAYTQPDLADFSVGGIRALEPGDPILRRMPTPTFFDLGTHRLTALVEFDSQTALLATDWGLHLLTEEAARQTGDDPRVALLDAPTPVLDLELVRGNLCVASVADGRVLFVRADDPDRAIPTRLSRDAADAVQEVVSNDSMTWSRTPTSVELWDLSRERVLRRWDLPDSVKTQSLAIARGGGVWVGTSRGLWRVREREALALPVTWLDVTRGAVSKVFEHSGKLVLLVDGKLYRVELDLRPGQARLLDRGADLVLGAWRDGPVDGEGWAIVQYGEQPPSLTRGVARSDGATLISPRYSGRGRHRIRAWRIGPMGERLEPAAETWQVNFDRSARVNAIVLLLSSALLGAWAFGTKRRWTIGLIVGVGVLALCALVHRGLYYDLPWGSLTGVSVAIGGTGIALRERERSRHVPRPTAIARLDDLLRGFRHRGGGLNPIDELRIHVINLSLLRETEPDFDETLRGILRRVLDATDDLSGQGPALVEFTGLEETLMRRFFNRLDELRTLCVELLEDRRRYALWLVRPDEHLACSELCTSFTQAVESMTELLARHRAVIVERFLPGYCGNLDRRGPARVEFCNPDHIETLPFEQGQLSELLDNLVGNALRAMAAIESPRIRVSLASSASSIVIRFEDNGPGIPPRLRERVFEHGYSGSGSGGFGLTRCRELVAEWGGTLRCGASDGLGGACFEIRIPLVVSDTD